VGGVMVEPAAPPATLPAHSLQVDERIIASYAELTRDFNPLHLDAAFASRTAMGGVIAHGTMALCLLLQSLEAGLGSHALAGLDLDIRFVRPVRPGDVIVAGGATHPSAAGTYRVWVRDAASGEERLAGTATLRDRPQAADRRG